MTSYYFHTMGIVFFSKIGFNKSLNYFKMSQYNYGLNHFKRFNIEVWSGKFVNPTLVHIQRNRLAITSKLKRK